jgi:hypothetical protein
MTEPDPGLAWRLEMMNWVPWKGMAGPRGLSLTMEHGDFSLGRRGELVLRVAAPKSEDLILELALPTGFEIDADRLPSGATFYDGLLRVEISAGHDAIMTYPFQVIPTLEGSLWTGPAKLMLKRDRDQFLVAPPQVWVVP